MKYILVISNKANKNIKSIPENYKKRIKVFISKLEDYLFPERYDIIKNSGHENRYRCRIGVYRVVYELEDNKIVIEIVNIDHRKDVYK